MEILTACGTLVYSKRGELLICHISGNDSWDIPMGFRKRGESALLAARRSLYEHVGILVDEKSFNFFGDIGFGSTSKLILHVLRAPNDFVDLANHILTVNYVPNILAEGQLEFIDGIRWVKESDVNEFCTPWVARRLLGFSWSAALE
ncbi:NUDIX domain-containing protein [Duganella sp. FT135W]|uniref:NUDIX domain-containing protein n=1 Tax=Duganella flavida TaxID=2692175 RepID=A0A6L8KH98_9BURK|nr:NUDIX domain-containing protein [Duganella flavida]MYM26410.1 NUDIX domain-containing protein [Duganella flavida]